LKSVNIITKRAKRDYARELRVNGFADIRGRLEVSAFKNGKQIHYDAGDNVVTIWAKHATMHLLTGEIFSSHGRQRSFLAANHEASSYPGEGVNNDGTLLSEQQYFADNTDPNFSLSTRWSESTVTPNGTIGDNTSDGLIYPFFPSKMLFGTGFEWGDWASIDAEYQTVYDNQGWDQSIFESNMNISENDYSNDTSGSAILPRRTMNDIYSGSLSGEAIADTDFGIAGAIKDGAYSDSDLYKANLVVGEATGPIKTEELDDGNEFLIKEWAGVGNPSFIYARRENRFFEGGSEVALSSDEGEDIENKITYTVVMPEQTGSNAGIFYPYNGYTLKVAGLFCDARLVLGNVAAGLSGTEAEVYESMPHGIMMAKRYISPIQKSHDVSISSRWTLYL